VQLELLYLSIVLALRCSSCFESRLQHASFSSRLQETSCDVTVHVCAEPRRLRRLFGLCNISGINNALLAKAPQLTLMRFGSCFLADSFFGMVMISTAAQNRRVCVLVAR